MKAIVRTRNIIIQMLHYRVNDEFSELKSTYVIIIFQYQYT